MTMVKIHEALWQGIILNRFKNEIKSTMEHVIMFLAQMSMKNIITSYIDPSRMHVKEKPKHYEFANGTQHHEPIHKNPQEDMLYTLPLITANFIFHAYMWWSACILCLNVYEALEAKSCRIHMPYKEDILEMDIGWEAIQYGYIGGFGKRCINEMFMLLTRIMDDDGTHKSGACIWESKTLFGI
ncbi:hypothetical protein ACJX0J_031924, partial [Zea mays]